MNTSVKMSRILTFPLLRPSPQEKIIQPHTLSFNAALLAHLFLIAAQNPKMWNLRRKWRTRNPKGRRSLIWFSFDPIVFYRSIWANFRSISVASFDKKLEIALALISYLGEEPQSLITVMFLLLLEVLWAA